jgi:hypothetical protein
VDAIVLAAPSPYHTSLYVNFLMDEGEERIRQAYGAKKSERLKSLKRKYDKTNFPRLNQNISPDYTRAPVGLHDFVDARRDREPVSRRRSVDPPHTGATHRGRPSAPRRRVPRIRCRIRRRGP